MPPFEVRPCLRDDIPAVVDLLLTGGRAAPGVTVEQIRRHAEAVYFDNPWVREDIPSLVSVDEKGRLEGFVGVIPRTMRFGSEIIDVAVPGNFVVRASPEGKTNSFAAIALLKRFFAGPQHLSVTDTANELSRRLWEAAGAVVPGLFSLDWFRPIRPATAILQMMQIARGRPIPLERPIRMAARTADLAGARLLARLGPKQAPFDLEPLERARLLELLDGRDRQLDIRSHYEPATLEWLLGMLEARAQSRTLRQSLVLDDRGARVGAFIYLLASDGVAEVLLTVAAEGKFELVLQAVLADATSLGGSVVTGRVNPRQLPAFKGQRCFMLCNQWTMVHSRRPELLDAFHRGRARLTALDGERWAGFGDLFGVTPERAGTQ